MKTILFLYSLPVKIILISGILLMTFFTFPDPLVAQNALKYHPALKSKQYQRSEWFASARTDSAGSMGSYLRALNAVQQEAAGREVPGNYQATQWYPLGPAKTTHPVLAQLGLVSCIWIDTSNFQTILAGSNTGGIFRTTDGGDNWTSLSDNYITTGVLSIQVDPADKNRIFIGTGHLGFGRAYGNGVMKSTDGGVSWEQTGLNSSSMAANFTVRKLMMQPGQPGTMLAILNTEFRQKAMIYRTTDWAENWEEVYSDNGAELFSIKSDPLNPEIIYATGNRFLKSTDAGLTWTDQSATLPLDSNFVVSRVEIAKTPYNPDLVLTLVENYDTTGTNPSARLELYRSTDNGLNYTKINLKYNPYAGYWKMEFGISPASSDEFYLGGIWLYKYRIEEDSAKFIYCSDHKYHHDVRDLHIFATSEKDLMYMANDGGVSKSETGAESWFDITRNGLTFTQFHNIAIGENSDMMFAGPQDANLSIYNFKTGVWSKNAKVSDAYGGAIDHSNPDIVYLVSYPPRITLPNKFLLKSTDGGNYFEFFGTPDSTEIGRIDKPIEMDPVDPNTLYAGVRDVWKTTDGAVTWNKISNFPAAGEPKLISVRVAPSNNNVIAAAFENPTWAVPSVSKLWITPDGGNHWLNITPTGTTSLDYAGIADISFHPETPLKFWLSLDREWANHRVYMTSDGGATWQNFSEGLPPIPVNTIGFVKGAGYDVLLAATDAGVYYRDESMTRWELFGQGLPLTIVADLKISYSRRKIVAGTFGRGLWEADLCMPLTEGELVISDTTEWAGKRKVLQDVVINPGGKLTIRSTIEMGLNRKIKVLPGGELIIDRGTLTNDCAGMWDGVRLYGSADYNNTTLPQGKISLLHGSSIQHADTAIRTIGVDETGHVIPGTGGGIIYTYSAKIINNGHGVEINPSEGINPSEFIMCLFETEKTLPDGSEAGDLVSLKGSKGVKFISCQFENSLPVSDFPYHERGVGINSFNSSFSVGKLQSADSIPFGLNAEAVFKQLSSGIRATASSPAFPVNVSNVRFDRNLTGIYLSGLNLSSIRNCSFSLNSSSLSDSLKPAATAIYLDNCAFFDLSGNTIKGPLGAFVPKSKTAGIIINRSGELNHTLYANTITNTNFAVLAQNSNRSLNGKTGLRLLSNWFDSNEYDICFTNDSSETNNGGALHQGSTGPEPGSPAGNHFSYSKLHRDGDIHNAGEYFYYHYYNGPDSLAQLPLSYYKAYPVEANLAIPAESTYKPAYMLVSSDKFQEAFSELSVISAQAHSDYTDLLDGGNTLQLLNEINSCQSEQAPALTKRLIQLSPYLSSEVLNALVKHQKSIPNLLIFEVLLVNPQMVRDTPLMAAIGTMDPPLESYMIVALAGAYNMFSGLEFLDARTDALRSARDLLFGQFGGCLYKSFLNDKEINPLILHLQNDDRPESQYLSAFLELNTGKTDQAEEIINQIPWNFPGLEVEVHENLSSLFNLNRSLFSEGRLPDALNADHLLLLVHLLQFPETSVFANNILNYYGHIYYNEPYFFPGAPLTVQSPVIPPVVFSGAGFEVYPVPAASYVILDYYSEQEMTDGLVKINNMSGQLVKEIRLTASYGQQMIDVSGLETGSYIFIMSNGSATIGERKVIIAR
ncbi:MAG: T9SS type A sorting domain-containing protein [Lentimicrobium sp.]